MKVLHLVPRLDWAGGVETYLLNLWPLLTKNGVRNVIAYGLGDRALASNSYFVPRLNSLSISRDRSVERELEDVVRRESPDLIHIHHINNVWAIRAACGLRTSVMTAHGYQLICPASDLTYDRTGRTCNRVCSPLCFAITWLERCMSRNPRYSIPLYHRSHWAMRNYREFAALICPSHYVAERHISAGFDPAQLYVVPYFCPLEPLPYPREEPPVPRLLFLGRITKAKGYAVFIKVLGLLPHVRGTIIGNTSRKVARQLSRLAKRYNCDSRVEIRTWISRAEVDQVMKETTILVFPSLSPETLGIVGLEALACGVPVVASNVGGVTEWLLPRKTGLLACPGNAEDFAAKINELLESPQLRKEMGHNGIDLIKTKFSKAKHLETLIGIYESCISRGWRLH